MRTLGFHGLGAQVLRFLRLDLNYINHLTGVPMLLGVGRCMI